MAEDHRQKIDKLVSDSPAGEDLNARLTRLEKKANLLIGLTFLQALLISALLMTYLLPKLFVYLQVILILGSIIAAVYFFRKQIPGWFGTAARSMFAFLDEAKNKA